MKELTEYQQKTLGAILGRTCEYPITGKEVARIIGLKPRDSGKGGADMRSIIHALRAKGYPICASSDGYWWPQNKDELNAYIQTFQNRVNEQQVAVDGMRLGFDKIASPEASQPVNVGVKSTFEVDGVAHIVDLEHIEAFMVKYPHARKIS